MNKKQFTDTINELISLREDEENLNKALKRFSPDLNYLGFGRYEDLIVRSLEFAVGDKCCWISYWLYDCEAGKSPLKVTDKHGKRVPIKTISNLYDLIKKGI